MFWNRNTEKDDIHLLAKSCCDGNEKEVKNVLNRHPNLLNRPLNELKSSALMLGCEKRQEGVVELLLSRGADVNYRDGSGWTPLIMASQSGNKKIIEMLLAVGAPTNKKDNVGLTAIDHATSGEIATLLQTFWINQIWDACRDGIVKDVERVLKLQPSMLDHPLNADGDTALILASWEGQKEVVEKLLSFGAGVNNQTRDGDTALSWASSFGRTEVVMVLLSSGANVNHKNNNARTALMEASKKGEKEVVEILLSAGADVNHQDKSGSTALIWASRVGHKGVIEKLLASGANVALQTHAGETAVRIAKSEDVVALIENYVPPSPPSGSTLPISPSEPQGGNGRLDDVELEDLNNNLPIRGVWDKFPTLSFKEAVRVTQVQGILEDDIKLCRDYFESIEDPPSPLTIDEASAVRFYTMETPFYGAFNRALRTRDRDQAKPFFAFLQLLLLAMHKLPKSTGTLYRGTRNLPQDIIDEYKRKASTKKCVFWSACSSTTTSVATLQNPMFCGKEGNRIKFTIESCGIGVDVKAISAIGLEDEVLLPPCVRLKVESYVDLGHGLLEFQLKYSAPPGEMLQLNPPPAFLSSGI